MSADRRWRRLQRKVWELLAWRNISTRNLESWTAISSTGEAQDIRLGERWDVYGTSVRLRTELDESAPEGALLDLLLDGDGLVFLDGQFSGAISPFEREISIAGARLIEVEVSPNDSFGRVGETARIKVARLIQPNNQMRQLFRSLSLAVEFCADLTESDGTTPVLDAIEEALNVVSLPSDADTVLHRTRILRDELLLSLEEARSLSRHYGYLHPERAIEHLLIETEHFNTVDIPALSGSETQPSNVSQALGLFSQRMDEISRRFPPVGELSVTSHAHLDVAWLWPLDETRRKIRHTFANVVTLMERYPDFVFTASSAQLYAYVQHDDPDLFEKIRGLVARWTDRADRRNVAGTRLQSPLRRVDGTSPSGRSALFRTRVRSSKHRRVAARHVRTEWEFAADFGSRRHALLLHTEAELERHQSLPARSVALGGYRRDLTGGPLVRQPGRWVQRPDDARIAGQNVAQLPRQSAPPGEPLRLRHGRWRTRSDIGDAGARRAVGWLSGAAALQACDRRELLRRDRRRATSRRGSASSTSSSTAAPTPRSHGSSASIGWRSIGCKRQRRPPRSRV